MFYISARFPSLAGRYSRAQACQAGRILEESWELVTEAKEVALIKVASKIESRVVNLKWRKRGSEAGWVVDWGITKARGTEASIYSGVESRIQTSGKPGEQGLAE